MDVTPISQPIENNSPYPLDKWSHDPDTGAPYASEAAVLQKYPLEYRAEGKLVLIKVAGQLCLYGFNNAVVPVPVLIAGGTTSSGGGSGPAPITGSGDTMIQIDFGNRTSVRELEIEADVAGTAKVGSTAGADDYGYIDYDNHNIASISINRAFKPGQAFYISVSSNINYTIRIA